MDRRQKAFESTEIMETKSRGTKLAIVAVALLMVGYMVAMLLVPAMPVGDPMGGFTQIPRLELWLLYVASLGSIWEQWTVGYPATITDRALIGLCAGLWLLIAYALGRPVVRQDALHRTLSPWVTSALAIACGSAVASLCVALNGMSFGTQSRLGLAAWFSGVWLALTFGLPRLSKRFGIRAETVEWTPQATPSSHLSVDDSHMHSWSRRLFGLSVVGGFWVAILTVAGACLPSYDMDVREHRMMAAKEYFLSGSIHSIARNSESNGPQACMMPALLWMNVLCGSPSTPITSHESQQLLNAVLIGQATQAALWLVGLVMLYWLLSQRYGLLAASVVSFAAIAHPGMFELVRLGGGAGGAGLWIISSVAVLSVSGQSSFPRWSALCVASGAAGTSWLLAWMIGIPIVIALLRDVAIQNKSNAPFSALSCSLRCINWLILLMVVAGVWMGNTLYAWSAFSEDWGRAGGLSGAWLAYRFPLWGMPWIDRLSAGISTLCRVLFDSTAHGLILVPLSLVGLFVGPDRLARATALGWAIWVIVWWLLTPQMDRDWVLAIPLLAWPAAHGIAWLQRHSQRTLILAIGGVSLMWSVVMLAAWPTSDNRILAPMHALLEVRSQREGSEQGRGAATAPEYVDWLNTYWQGTDASGDGCKKVLLVGSADAFRLAMPTEQSGLFDIGLWDGMLMELENRELADRGVIDSIVAKWLTQYQVSHVVFDWKSLRGRDAILGMKREVQYRDAVQRLMASGTVRSVPWEFLSSDAELLEVVPPS